MSTASPSLLRACARSSARILTAAALAFGLLAVAPTESAQAAKHRPTRVERAMQIAVAQKGDPYAYGAAGPARFDCSGLTFYSFRRAGFSAMPRTSSAQAHFATRISRTKMRRGDLMFFYGSGGVYHVGVFAGFYRGRRQVLHAPYSGTRVRTEPVWTDAWYPGTLRFR